MRGLLVAFEGGEGAGKSSRVAAARVALRERGIPVTATRQPGGTPLGQRLREMLLDGKAPGPRAEALLYAADKAEHVDLVLRPALDRGHVVLCDRYIDSTIAYQGAGRGLDVGLLCRWSTDGLVADLTILLDVPPEVGLERANRRGDANRFEAEALNFHRAVNERFRALARRDRNRYFVLDATRDPAELDTAIVNAIVSMRETGSRPNVPVDSFGVHGYYPDNALIASAIGAEGVDGHERPEPG